MNDYGQEFKKRLNRGMRTLQGLGFIAPAKPHACCMGCGYAEIPMEDPRAVVFYHAQDAERFSDGLTYLAYDPNGHGNEFVLQAMRMAFENNGLTWQHSGDQKERPKVFLTHEAFLNDIYKKEAN